MQFMYLRRTGNKNNPGNHPFGMVGVKLMPDGKSVHVETASIVSGDRFQKNVGRRIIELKFMQRLKLAAVTITNEQVSNEAGGLRLVLNKSVYNRISDKVRANEIFRSIIADEIAGKMRQMIKENGCAP